MYVRAMETTELLGVLVDAHETPHPSNGHRQAIDMFKTLGSSGLQHHALETEIDIDEARLEELSYDGLLDLDYGTGIIHITPTRLARNLVSQHRRVDTDELLSNVDDLDNAVSNQMLSSESLSWQSTAPVLAALVEYWRGAGCPSTGIALPAVLQHFDEPKRKVLLTDLGLLIESDFLASASDLAVETVPAEVAITEKALQALFGWPGLGSEDWVERLLAALEFSAASEPDSTKKKRLKQLGDAIRDVGTTTVAEIVAKQVSGAI